MLHRALSTALRRPVVGGTIPCTTSAAITLPTTPTTTTTPVRFQTTAAQKRALSKKQLAGTPDATVAAAAATTAAKVVAPGPPTSSNQTSAPPPPPPQGGGGKGGWIGVTVLAAAAGVGGYMYANQLGPFEVVDAPKEASPLSLPSSSPSPSLTPTPSKQPSAKETVEQQHAELPTDAHEPKPTADVVGVAPKKKRPSSKVPVAPVLPSKERTSEPPVVPTAATSKKKQWSNPGVTKISLPPPGTRPFPAGSVSVAQISHPTGGHRVAMAPSSSGGGGGTPVVVAPSEETFVTSAHDAAKELRLATEKSSDQTLQMVHKALRANLDETLLQDLDSLSSYELKVRVIQLAAEMKDRTKWEAVRLKELLVMKEKETGDNYMELLQQQRIEFEGLVARRLLEQEDTLTRQANALLQEKEHSIQAVVTAAADALQAEHQADLTSTEERLNRELHAKYETEYSTNLANEKATYSTKLAQNTTDLEELSQTLQQLEAALQASNTFKSGSLHAHLVTAAALALSNKMETSKGATEELAALTSAVGGDGVIAAAVAIVPASVRTGVPTLSELQTKFEAVYTKSRQASLVPEGWPGLEGQLLGMIFSTLKISPSPDDAASEENKDDADYALVRAQRHVQLGELDRAVEQLDKLKGQAAFTAADWKKDAHDRIMIEKALKVIKMECSLLNQSMRGDATSE